MTDTNKWKDKKFGFCQKKPQKTPKQTKKKTKEQNKTNKKQINVEN